MGWTMFAAGASKGWSDAIVNGLFLIAGVILTITGTWAADHFRSKSARNQQNRERLFELCAQLLDEYETHLTRVAERTITDEQRRATIVAVRQLQSRIELTTTGPIVKYTRVLSLTIRVGANDDAEQETARLASARYKLATAIRGEFGTGKLKAKDNNDDQ